MLLRFLRKIKEFFNRRKSKRHKVWKSIKSDIETHRMPQKPTYPIPKSKNFKPRPAYEKRVWSQNKKMPRKFKDEDED
jgi:hypothetical protein